MKDGFYAKPADAAPTPHLFVANCGPAVGIAEPAVRELFQRLDCTRLDLSRSGVVCASFADAAQAERARAELESSETACRFGRRFAVKSAEYVAPAAEREAEPGTPVFLTAEETGVPGLALHPDFVTEQEEQELLQAVDGAPWEALASRRVQHYGFRFEYKTRNVDRGHPVSPLPPATVGVLQRLQELPGMPAFDQLTVNEYAPGVGLAPHVDTHSAFTGAIVALSLAGGCVMELRLERKRRGLWLPRRSLLVLAGPARLQWQHYIPHRRADAVAGASVPRAARRVSLTFRQVRSSPCDCAYPQQCDSQAGRLPLTRLQQLEAGAGRAAPGTAAGRPEPAGSSQPAGGSAAREAADGGSRGGADVERRHVHAVYEVIAAHFSATRFAVWPKVREFLAGLPPGAVLADVGCGNGKYFGVRPDAIVLGSDRSSGLAAQAARLCRQQPDAAGSHPHAGADGAPRAPRAGVCVADALQLPLRSACADAAICVAVLHHLSSRERRRALLTELRRALRPGGTALVTVWASQQEDAGKLARWQPLPRLPGQGAEQEGLAGGDFFVPWHVPFHRAAGTQAVAQAQAQASAGSGQASAAAESSVDRAKGAVVFQRYYHLFDEGELEALVRGVAGLRPLRSFYDKSNWCCVFQREEG